VPVRDAGIAARLLPGIARGEAALPRLLPVDAGAICGAPFASFLSRFAALLPILPRLAALPAILGRVAALLAPLLCSLALFLPLLPRVTALLAILRGVTALLALLPGGLASFLPGVVGLLPPFIRRLGLRAVIAAALRRLAPILACLACGRAPALRLLAAMLARLSRLRRTPGFCRLMPRGAVTCGGARPCGAGSRCARRGLMSGRAGMTGVSLTRRGVSRLEQRGGRDHGNRGK
jgi:hypothetical protein